MAKKALLLNDTTHWYHFGCTATSTMLKQKIRNLGYELKSIPITETYKIQSAPQTYQDFLNEDYYHTFAESNPELILDLKETDIVVVNGEGTLHGLKPAPRSLLYVAYISKRFLEKNVHIVNHSAYPQDNSEDINEVYSLVYSTIDSAAIREPVSLRLMGQVEGANLVPSFDLLPFYVKEHYKMHGRKDEKKLVIAGSAMWLNSFNIASPEQGNISDYERAILNFIAYLKYMHQMGYKIEFLHSDACQEPMTNVWGEELQASYGVFFPAKDDSEFINTLFQLDTGFRDILTVVKARSLDEWLGHIEEAFILVSGRFHHTIAASCLGTKFIVLNSNTPKIEGLTEILESGAAVQYQDPNLTELLKQKTQQIITAGPLVVLDKLCKRAEQNFHQLEKQATIEVENYSGEGTGAAEYSNLQINQFYHKYYANGIKEILELRMHDAQLSSIVLDVILFEPIKFSSVLQEALKLLDQGSNHVISICNLNKKHWVGLVFQKKQGLISATYIDPENKAIVPDMLNEINKNFVIDSFVVPNVQKYSNCGPELIENIMLFLVGIRVSQEDAVPYHSKLLEKTLVDDDYGAVTKSRMFLKTVSGEYKNIKISVDQTTGQVLSFEIEEVNSERDNQIPHLKLSEFYFIYSSDLLSGNLHIKFLPRPHPDFDPGDYLYEVSSDYDPKDKGDLLFGQLNSTELTDV